MYWGQEGTLSPPQIVAYPLPPDLKTSSLHWSEETVRVSKGPQRSHLPGRRERMSLQRPELGQSDLASEPLPFMALARMSSLSGLHHVHP